MPAPLAVAAGVIRDARGRILLSQRHQNKHQGGLWEFPGGKLDAGETVPQALSRELAEELGIQVHSATPLITVTHHYPERSVVLHTLEVTGYRGEPAGREGQPLTWVEPALLHNMAMPAADQPIINAIRLPDCYAITGGFADEDDFDRRLGRLLERDIRLVQLRLDSARADEAEYWIRRALEPCREAGAQLLWNGAPTTAARLGCDGVHLNSRRLMTYRERPLGLDSWVAASCHNIAEIRQAADIGVDFICLSPVAATASHPQATPLGLLNFAQLTARSNLPVYALGGMGMTQLNQVRQAGGRGVAGIRGFWGD